MSAAAVMHQHAAHSRHQGHAAAAAHHMHQGVPPHSASLHRSQSEGYHPAAHAHHQQQQQPAASSSSSSSSRRARGRHDVNGSGSSQHRTSGGGAHQHHAYGASYDDRDTTEGSSNRRDDADMNHLASSTANPASTSSKGGASIGTKTSEELSAVAQRRRGRGPHVPPKSDEATKQLVPVLACVLKQLCTRNDKIPLDSKSITKFHALRPPAISVADYLERISKYAACSPECFVLALIYIDRIIQDNRYFAVNSLNVHRLLITSVMLAAKFYDDQYYNNAYYGKVGGVPCKEINSLEIEFLFMINFNLFISGDQYYQYQQELIQHSTNQYLQCPCPRTINASRLPKRMPLPSDDDGYDEAHAAAAAADGASAGNSPAAVAAAAARQLHSRSNSPTPSVASVQSHHSQHSHHSHHSANGVPQPPHHQRSNTASSNSAAAAAAMYGQQPPLAAAGVVSPEMNVEMSHGSPPPPPPPGHHQQHHHIAAANYADILPDPSTAAAFVPHHQVHHGAAAAGLATADYDMPQHVHHQAAYGAAPYGTGAAAGGGYQAAQAAPLVNDQYSRPAPGSAGGYHQQQHGYGDVLPPY